MGVHLDRRGELVSRDQDFRTGGLRVIRVGRRLAPPNERLAAWHRGVASIRVPEPGDAAEVAERICGGGVCDSSTACGIRGMGGGTERRAVRGVLVCGFVGLRLVHGAAGCRAVSVGSGGILPWADVEADGRDASILTDTAGSVALAARHPNTGEATFIRVVGHIGRDYLDGATGKRRAGITCGDSLLCPSGKCPGELRGVLG